MKQNFKCESLLEITQSDNMLREFHKEYIVEGSHPSKEEAIQNLRFFATFAVGCMKVGLEELGQVFCQRTNVYALLLKQCGYKTSRYFVGRKAYDFNDLLTRAFWGIG